MNKAQKKIIIAVAIWLVITFLFPPHAFGDRATRMGYAFIGNIPYGASVHIFMLLTEWLGIAMIGGISYFIAQDTQREYTTPPQSNSSKGSTTVQPSTPDAMNKYKRWLIRIIGFLFVLIIYTLWRGVDKETGGLFPGSALLRGALVFISLSWIVKISNAKSVYKELKSETYPEKTNKLAKVWLLVIGVVILIIWLAQDQENKNTLPVSATPTQSTQAQTQPAQAQQATPLSSNSAEYILQNANDLYNQGRYEESLPLFRQLAEQGNAAAQNTLGWMYANGKGVAQDYREALAWYRKAAEQGEANAQTSLGWMYDYGKGVKQDYSQAVAWYRKAAEQGAVNAQYNLGVMYDNGQGVKQDYQQALQWYRKAADQGNAQAEYSLGLMYRNGQGVKQDYQKAQLWYRKAAEQGEAIAQNDLGDMYENGHGVDQDYTQALAWYRKAAAQGEAIAQYSLGLLYFKGRGVAQDNNQAVAWYRKAAEQGQENAIAALKELGR